MAERRPMWVGQLEDEVGLGPVERRAPILPSRPNQNRAPGVSATIVIRKPMTTSRICQAELPAVLVMPRACHQLQAGRLSAQAETVAQPIGSPAWATVARSL